MKTLATTILNQRTETEQFFLESLQEVKEIIKHERKRTHPEEMILLNKMRSGGGGKVLQNGPNASTSKVVNFPPLTVKGANLHLLDKHKVSNLPAGELDKVKSYIEKSTNISHLKKK